MSEKQYEIIRKVSEEAIKELKHSPTKKLGAIQDWLSNIKPKGFMYQAKKLSKESN
jgi:hypothetical protein